ncbi:uncharacterized protein LOC103279721 [Anolis carolinensis]|uniref:uncharacterized protein LOC103279721 n=1 Tax=Anolis carolinensis TaxID=28377 RepID=UPI002F2B39B0
MGRPRKTSAAVSSPRPAATAPKVAPAAPPSSASSKSSSASRGTKASSAAKSEGVRQGGKQAYTPSVRGTDQTRSTTTYGGEQGDGWSSRATRAKTSTAAGGTSSSSKAAGSTLQAAPKTQGKSAQTQGKSCHLPPPLSAEKVVEIEQKTRGQRNNPEWYLCRENRITASVASKIANSKFANGRTSEVPQSYLKDVTRSGPRVQTPAMSWGIRNEKKAVESYEALKSRESHKAVKVDDCGLFIDKEKPWLGASPDGILKEAKTGKEIGIVEVKCPYKHRDKTVTEACKDKAFCLEKKGDSYSLKKTHPYYTQVQCQMGVTGHDKADLVVYTNKETAIAPVDFDPDFWENTVPKLEKFYTEAVVPHVQEKTVAARAKEE